MTRDEQLAALREFAQGALEYWPEGGIDGGDLQALAEGCGLLEMVEATEPCGDECFCEEWPGLPCQCMRKTELLTGRPEGEGP